MNAIFLKPKGIHFLMLAVALIMSINGAIAQNSVNYTGVVVDDSNTPLIGVSVIIESTHQGTTTSNDGTFSINAKSGDVLEFSYIGYVSQRVTLAQKTSLSIVMAEDSELIDDVVVVGFATQKKANLTGAVSTVDVGLMSDRPITQSSQALQGMVAGVYVNTASSEPGNDAASITIRGIGSLNQSSEPLVIIDGIEGSMNNVVASDIESISVLKDAAAASIYGTRAAQGVILIKTKRGKFDAKTQVSYKGYFGVSSPTVLPDMVTDNVDYLTAYRTAANNIGKSHKITDEVIARYADMESYDYADYAIDAPAPIMNHELTIAGGKENISYYSSFGYLDQEGWLAGNNNSKRYSARTNIDAKINSRLTFGSTLSFVAKRSNLTPKDKGITSSKDKGSLIFSTVMVSHPMVPMLTENGLYGQQEQANPVNSSRASLQGIIDNEGGSIDENNFNGNAFLNFDFGKGFSAKAIIGVDNENIMSLYTRKAFDMYDFVTGKYTSTAYKGSSLEVVNSTMTEVTNQFLVNYDRSFDKHKINAFVGFNRQVRNRSASGSKETMFGSTDLVFVGNGTVVEATGTLFDKSSLISYFGRVNYNYDDRYLLEANLRRDASSRFAEKNRWGTFPSFSAGWLVSNENFWNVNSFDNLKVRASWGLLGTEPSDKYGYRNQFELGENYANQSGGAISANGNSAIKWEQTESVNVGLDMGLFNNKLNIIADYFVRNTSDILVELDNPLVMGIAGRTTFNAAAMQNKGWELTANYNANIGQVQFGIGANVTNVKNKIVAIDSSLSADADRLEIERAENIWWIRGESINSICGFEYIAPFKSQEEIDAVDHTYINGKNPELGDMRFKDQNGDNIINEEDYVVLGNRNPEWLYGFNFDAKYKNFDFSAVFQGTGNAYVNLSRQTGPFPFAGLRSCWLDAWSPENPDSNTPRLWVDRKGYNGQTIEEAGRYSSYWMENTKYLRLKNIQIGYTMPQALCQSVKLQRARIYVNGQNLWTLTGMKDFDPERSMLDNHATSTLPQSVIITAGIDLTF